MPKTTTPETLATYAPKVEREWQRTQAALVERTQHDAKTAAQLRKLADMLDRLALLHKQGPTGDPIFDHVREKCVAHLRAEGFSAEDTLAMSVARDGDELNSAMWDQAREVGDNKGWGDEGVGSLLDEWIDDIGPKLDETIVGAGFDLNEFLQ